MVRGQALAAVDRGSVGMAELSAAMLIGKIGRPEVREPISDDDADSRVFTVCAIDMGDGCCRAVDDAERILTHQEPDAVPHGQIQGLAVPGWRHRGDGDLIAQDLVRRLELGSHFLVESTNLGIGLGDQEGGRV